MSRIQQRFAELKAQGRKALIPYIAAGDPAPNFSVELMHGLVAAGSDILELGVPFSDPMADGPVIQQACERALEHDTSLSDVLAMVAEFRQKDADTPVVLMGYLNPIEIYGYQQFVDDAADAGVDGVLLVDLPPEEAVEPAKLMRSKDIDPIFLVAPTTTEARCGLIADVASGFVYYVSLKGVTGSAALDVSAVAEKLKMLRQKTDLPVGVGFGIRDAQSAAAVGAVADAVVIGSVLVNCVAEYHAENGSNPAELAQRLTAIVQPIRAALDALEA